MIDLFAADFNSLSNDARYSAITDFAHALPFESNRHDFKQSWSPKVVEDVAALANTFGGILMIGVKKGSKDVLAELIGVESKSELSTGIASSIATNISPTPSYEIMECFDPGEPMRRFCVIRVHSSLSVHLVTKKGTGNPVFVRNADESIPADSSRLRMMIDREKQEAGNLEKNLIHRAQTLLTKVEVSHGSGGAEPWPHGNCAVSPTYFRMALVANNPRQTTPIDCVDEERFVKLIHDHYPRIRYCVTCEYPLAQEGTDRSSETFDYRWFQQHLAYESRWRVTDNLDIIHAVQANLNGKWALPDLVIYSMLLFVIGAKWWELLGFFGEGILVADFSVKELKLKQYGSNFTHGFDPGVGEYTLGSSSVRQHPYPRQSASAQVRTNFTSMREDVPSVVTALMSSLLRSLGHGMRRAEFEEDVRKIWLQITQSI